VGHHPVGEVCGNTHLLPKVSALLTKYGFNTYYCGHAHSLGFFHQDGTSFYLSGAGGNMGATYRSKMDQPIYGFLKSRLVKGKLYGTYYYTKDKVNWDTWNAPVFDLKNGEIIESL